MSEHKLVHIIDDEDSVRRSMRYALITSGYLVESWPSGTAFLKDIRHVDHGCVLLDIRLPDLDGLEVQRELARRGVRMPVVVMTGHGDISIAVQAMKAGAVDFLEKPFPKAALLQAVDSALERIAAGDAAVNEAADAEVKLEALTPREHEVLEKLAQGMPNKMIAYDLGISSRTVEVHRANVMAKLNARSLAELLRIAFAAGLGALT